MQVCNLSIYKLRLFNVTDDLNYFQGVETMYENDIKVCVLKCHGLKIIM